MEKSITPPVEPTRRIRTALCVLALLLLCAALCARVPFGLDWTDEAYYSVLPYRLALGDRPLVDTWEVHQLSGVLALPFLKAYLLVTGGSTEGVMLYFRYVLVFMQLAVALYAFFVLRRKSGDAVALLSAGMLLMHVHYGLNGFSYNAMAPLLLMLSVLTLFDALDDTRPMLTCALSGAFYALSVQAYPFGLLTLPAYIGFFVLFTRRYALPAQKKFWRVFTCGVVGVAVLFAAYVLSHSALADIVQNAAFILRDPDHQAQNALLLFAQYGNATRVLFGPVFIVAVGLFAFSLVTRAVRSARIRLRMTQLGFALAVAVIAAAVAWVIPYEYPNHHKINLAAMSMTLVLPSVFVLSGAQKSRYLLPAALGILLSLAVQIGSNTGIRSSSGMLLIASVGTMLYLFDVLDQKLPHPFGAHAFRAVALLVCAAQLLLTTGLRMVTVYRDGALPVLTQRISAGPAKGVYTTPANAEKYALLYADITENAPQTGALLVTNLLPAAYLMTAAPPAAPSAFNMTADSPWLAEYYALHPEKQPACIFAADASIGHGNDLSLSGAQALADALALAARQLPSGTMFVD